MTDYRHYPHHDFRFLVQYGSKKEKPDQIGKTEDENEKNRVMRSIESSIVREPLPELLKYWKNNISPDKEDGECSNHSNHQENKNSKFTYDEWLLIFRNGLEQAISRERYPSFLMDSLQAYPEFYEAAQKGYIQLWCKLRFSLDIQNDHYQIYIGSIRGQDIFIPDQDKIRLTRLISQKITWPMQIGGQLVNATIYTSRKAENIYHRIFWLEQQLYKQGKEEKQV